MTKLFLKNSKWRKMAHGIFEKNLYFILAQPQNEMFSFFDKLLF
jgi:hypothetical protein